MLNECDLYAINRNITLKMLPENKTPAPESGKSQVLRSENITLISPQITDHKNQNQDQNLNKETPLKLLKEKNAQFYRTIARFITICFNRREKFVDSIGQSTQ